MGPDLPRMHWVRASQRENLPVVDFMANQSKQVGPTVLVTGGAGYIGSHVCKLLSERGYFPVTLDNLCRGFEKLVRWGPLEKADVTSEQEVASVIKKYSPVAVMHFAAYAYVGESVEHPNMYFENNVGGAVSLLHAMQSMKDPLLVFSSTCATYGVPMQSPIDESHPQDPINPYGQSKLIAEQMIQSYSDLGRLRGVSLRYFNAAGADSDGETGELHDPETHLIPLALKAALGVEGNLSIFGSDYETPDGTCIRDYVHVSDLAEAHVLALEHLLSGGPTKSYNLSNGMGFSVRQVVDAVSRVVGSDVPFEVSDRRPGDPPMLVGDSSAINADLGWAPRISDIDDIVESAWKYLSANG